MTKVPELLRAYLAILIQRLFTLHADLDCLALTFLLEPYKKLNDSEDCECELNEFDEFVEHIDNQRW